ncbi:MAG: DUF1801 domain-containing protein [Acidimicrobiia bacterium]|nr:DUF1801 domain-containing protein [Acidimicrobiia bacterium]
MQRNPDVDAWFAAKNHPMETAMQEVRTIILQADDRITETIKWSTPTFMFEGNIASFNPANKFVSLLFHTGAKIPGDFEGLEGDGETARVMRFADLQAVSDDRDNLEAVIKAWCDWKGS